VRSFVLGGRKGAKRRHRFFFPFGPAPSDGEGGDEGLGGPFPPPFRKGRGGRQLFFLPLLIVAPQREETSALHGGEGGAAFFPRPFKGGQEDTGLFSKTGRRAPFFSLPLWSCFHSARTAPVSFWHRKSRRPSHVLSFFCLEIFLGGEGGEAGGSFFFAGKGGKGGTYPLFFFPLSYPL